MEEHSKAGKYELRTIIGRGAAGVVYEGLDPVLARKVAIKTLPLAGQDEESREQYTRFQQEAQAAGRLHHPNIVAVYDYGETASHAFIVMEHLPGGSLKARIERDRPMSVEALTKVMRGLLAGLQHSHEHGVVHRDIKPANVVFDDSGEVKITDFGIARLESSSLTVAGSVLGTPAYMSPEQVLGETADLRSDIYSAGVILYEMLTGQRPFEGAASSIMHKIVNMPPPRPSGLPVQVPVHFDQIVATALAKAPEDRYQSAAEFARALHAKEDLTLPLQRQPAPPVPPRAPAPEVVAAAPPPPVTVPAPAMAAQLAAQTTVSVAARPARPLSPAMLGVAGLAVLLVGGGVSWSMLGGAKPHDVPVASNGVRPQPPPPPPGPQPAAPPAAPPAQPVVAAPSPAAPPAQTPPQTQTEAPPPTVASPTPPVPVVVPVPTPPPQDVPATVAAPAPPAPVQPTPMLAKPPPSEAPDPAAALRQVVAGPVGTMPCSLIRADFPGGNAVRVTGFTGLGDTSGMIAEGGLRAALSQAAGIASVEARIRRVDGPFCEVFDTLRPAFDSVAPAGKEIALSVVSSAEALANGGAIRLRATMPDFASSLRLDRFGADGAVMHLVVPVAQATLAKPGSGVPLEPSAATASAWVMGRGEGPSAIVAIASASPLALGRRPQREPAIAYLNDLGKAIAALRSDGGRVSVDVTMTGIAAP